MRGLHEALRKLIGREVALHLGGGQKSVEKLVGYLWNVLGDPNEAAATAVLVIRLEGPPNASEVRPADETNFRFYFHIRLIPAESIESVEMVMPLEVSLWTDATGTITRKIRKLGFKREPGKPFGKNQYVDWVDSELCWGMFVDGNPDWQILDDRIKRAVYAYLKGANLESRNFLFREFEKYVPEPAPAPAPWPTPASSPVPAPVPEPAPAQKEEEDDLFGGTPG